MCGAYGFLGTSGFQRSINLRIWFDLQNDPRFKDSFNIRPTMNGLIITRHSPNTGEIKPFGIKAPWDSKHILINAQAESVSEKRTFKNMYRESRCLIPASFYFEWQRVGEHKQPYCFKIKGADVFSFAGIYNDDGFVILTTAPNRIAEPVHHRMPLILHRENEVEWLNSDSDIDLLERLLVPYDGEMIAYPVSTLVNSAKNQGEEVIREYKSVHEKD